MSHQNKTRLEELLQQWDDHTLPPHLHDELLRLLAEADAATVSPGDSRDVDQPTTQTFSASEKEAMLTAIVTHRRPKIIFLRYAAAAAVLIAVALGFIYLRKPTPLQQQIAKQPTKTIQPNDIAAPASNKAILTLADGRQIVLDKAGEGSIANEGDINVIKQSDGQLVYTGNSSEMRWNTLTVPKGSQPVKLVLADGSHVILNAASSLTYPTVFSKCSRNVTMTGEAYFDVVQLSSSNECERKRPFVVTANNMLVEVKGTSFNVNAYDDEAAIKTTLLKGAVDVVAGESHQSIAPGQQAIISKKFFKNILLEKHADVDEATAWINGKFRFNNADVETVMRQVARWYDVEVKFAARPRLRFGGQMDRNNTLRQMFTILETSGLHFSLNENVVTILP